MQAYTAIYPWAVMILSILASCVSIIGGATTGFMIMKAPLNVQTGDSRTANICGGSFVIMISCLAACLCLYVGGKFVGAF